MSQPETETETLPETETETLPETETETLPETETETLPETETEAEENPDPESLIGDATYSPEDDKLRLYPFSRLSPEEYEEVKRYGFQWAPVQRCFYRSWHPQAFDLLERLCGEVGDESRTAADRAAERAERFQRYRENRKRDAEIAYDSASSIASGIPLGQPILVGHHSERKARKDAERIRSGFDRAAKAWRTSDYWRERAAGVLGHADYVQRPEVRYRRIKRLEASKRSHERTKAKSEKFIALWDSKPVTLERALAILNFDHIRCRFPEAEYPRTGDAARLYFDPDGYCCLSSALRAGLTTPEDAARRAKAANGATVRRAERWIEHYEHRLAYERAMLGESGGIAAEGLDIRAGGRVRYGRDSWATVLRVNRKDGKAVSVRVNARYASLVGVEQILQYIPPTEEEASATAKAMKLPPICNYLGEGFRTMTKAEWAETHSERKMLRTVAATETAGAHRVRVKMFAGFSLCPVFIVDEKEKRPPTPPKASEPVATVPPSVEVPASPRAIPPALRKDPHDPRRAEAERIAKHGLEVRSVHGPDLYPTPIPIARQIAQRCADFKAVAGSRILEPSAGLGNLVSAMIDKAAGADCCRVVCFDISEDCCKALRDRRGITVWASEASWSVLCQDFLSVEPSADFDFVVMNPPFSNASDIRHVDHAIGFLRPERSRLVAIMAAGPRQTAWLKSLRDSGRGLSVECEPLPDDAFRAAGAAVRTILVTITREGSR
jgi:hypothetical protein